MNHQDDNQDDNQDQDAPQGLSDIEESAFYESGLTAHGCIDNLDAYAMESIKRYGRIIFNATYKDATAFKAYKEYTGLMLDSERLKEELEEVKERCEKLEKAMKYSPSGESLLCKFIQATQDVHEANETIKGDNIAWVELKEELKDTIEKLRFVTCHRNDLMDSVSNLQKEIRLLKAIMDMMKDKANE